MPCHQHRCCRRAVSAADIVALPVDYVLLAAADPNVTEGAATMLRGAGVPVERHELGLRLSARGTGYRAALAHLCDTLAPAARRGVRVVFIPVGADAIGFQRALLASQSLDAFQQHVAAVPPTVCASPDDGGSFGDVFKGESLE
ncbi:MAG: hypothetical protein M3478_00390 [Planctomycetota bacterium]|nr:hypothetical protein [Planctomycetota bacterium]